MNHRPRIRGRIVKSPLAPEFTPFDVSRFSGGECPKSASDSAISRLCGGHAAPEISKTKHDIYAGRADLRPSGKVRVPNRDHGHRTASSASRRDQALWLYL